MANRLSHSQINKYQRCPQAWDYHYNKRIRSKTFSAALFLGTAIDKAMGAMLDPNAKQSPQTVFEKIWRFQEINGKQEYLPNSPNVVYSNTEFDEDLLHPEDVQKLKEEYKVEDPITKMKELYKEKEYSGFEHMALERKKLFNNLNWYCLYRKGLLMLEALKKEVVPNITKVYHLQEYVKLENDEGDEVIGYVDLVASYKGYEVPIVFDLKTSSKMYEKDSVILSPQLSLYVHGLSEKYKTRKAGYIVLLKTIHKNKTKICSICKKDGTGQRHKTCDAEVSGKRCNGAWIETMKPEAQVQVLIDEIPTQTEDLVLDNYQFINESIKNGVIYRNLQSCKTGYGLCEFFSLCYKGKMDGLVKLEEK